MDPQLAAALIGDDPAGYGGDHPAAIAGDGSRLIGNGTPTAVAGLVRLELAQLQHAAGDPGSGVQPARR